MSDANSEELPPLKKMGYLHAVYGKELYNFFGNKVIEHTTRDGKVLAVKLKPHRVLKRSEGEMMQYASDNGVLAPKVRGTYEIVTKGPIGSVIVSDRVPGVALDEVWEDFTEAEQSSIKDQLREQIKHMRACKQEYIGCLNRQETRCQYDRVIQTYFGPFENEDEFDKWCLKRVRGGPLVRFKWKNTLARLRKESSTPGKSVLTHGDLTPRNIMVEGSKITGIIDWEKSGFFPEYAEYAFAMVLGHEIEKWWKPVLEEVLGPCPKERVEFTKKVENRGF